MIPIAQEFIKELDKDKKTIILPAPIVTEMLAPVDNEQRRNEIITDFNLSFRIAAFDARAAAISGKIWNERRNDWKEYYSEGSETLRNRFKYDLLIPGCALASKVECLYTGDGKLFKLAKNYLKAENIFDSPDRRKSFQPSLFY